MKHPPYGRELASRLSFNNPPFLVAVCVGMDAWKRAKEQLNNPNDFHALVMPPEHSPDEYIWPVSDQLVVIDVACGPTDDQLRKLAIILLQHGAETVTVYSRDGLNRFDQYRLKQQEAA
jgi:hypothetical protein